MRRLALIAGLALVSVTTGSTPAQSQTSGVEQGKKPAVLNVTGTVKSATGDSLVVTGRTTGKDTDWTFTVDPRTKIRKAGKDITAGDIAAGDAVHVRYHAEGGRNVAESVVVRTTGRKATTPPEGPTKAGPRK